MAQPGKLLAIADRIGCRLCRDAVWADGACNWLGWSMEYRNGQWAPAWRAMGGLLYDGTAGIGLFLAHLHAMTEDAIARETARGALVQALSTAETLERAGEYGFYAGLSGIAYCCLHAAPLLDDERLAECGRNLLLRIARMDTNPQRLDVINGSAGLIPFLIADGTDGHRDELLAAACRHADQLLAQAHRTAEGWSWNTLGTQAGRNLVGYSHGTAGIACALAELGRETGRTDLLEGTRAALQYERTHFRPEQGNWPDFREFAGAAQSDTPCMLAWCHGAPGIGMARLRLLPLLPDDPMLRDEVEIAITTTAASLPQPATASGGSFCLCHGHGGNAELLILAADQFDSPELRQRAEALAVAAITPFEHENTPWPCGVPGAGETPNLLLGLAGIGHFFLRLEDSRRVPSVLSIGPSIA
jgi:type 2 lantibiotic biosynthesis protein LanM